MAHQPYDPYYHHHRPQQDYGFKDRTINTLFVSGLPDNVKAREIHNLFRARPGFDDCQLKYTGRGNQVVAFATFFNHQSAVSALRELNGAKFDPQTGDTLHIELARSNSRRVRKPGSGPYVVIDNRHKSARRAHETPSEDGYGENGESDKASEDDKPGSGNKDVLETTKSGDAATDIENGVSTGNLSHNHDNQEETVTTGGLQPRSTLFIANLGPTCTEEELKQALSQFPGFNTLKLQARGGMPVAFADFEETEQANKAMEELQGSILLSSDRGGMHIEYARSKMRKPINT